MEGYQLAAEQSGTELYPRLQILPHKLKKASVKYPASGSSGQGESALGFNSVTGGRPCTSVARLPHLPEQWIRSIIVMHIPLPIYSVQSHVQACKFWCSCCNLGKYLMQFHNHFLCNDGLSTCTLHPSVISLSFLRIKDWILYHGLPIHDFIQLGKPRSGVNMETWKVMPTFI